MIEISIKILVIIIIEYEDSFINSVSIILNIIQISLYFTLRMTSEYICPRCQSKEIIKYEDHIECLQCGFNFSIETLDSDIDIENIAAEEDLKSFIDGFEEEERKRLEKIFEENDFS